MARHLILTAAIICASLPAFADAAAPAVLPTSSDHLAWPVQITKGYVFVEGNVNGRAGVFMFDTGTPFRFFFNHGYAPIELSKYLGIGRAGSGQRFKVYEPGNVGTVQLAGRELSAGEPPVRSADFSFMADMGKGGIRPDILGMAGFALVSGYEFVLDYRAATLDFYRIADDGSPVVAHAKADDIIATLPFDYSSNHLPRVRMFVDGVEIEVLFDTGALGDLTLTPKARRALEKSGRLKRSNGDYQLDGLAYQEAPLAATVPKLVVGKHNSLKAGYSFLRQYRSVWNFKTQKITLLRQ